MKIAGIPAAGLALGLVLSPLGSVANAATDTNIYPPKIVGAYQDGFQSTVDSNNRIYVSKGIVDIGGFTDQSLPGARVDVRTTAGDPVCSRELFGVGSDVFNCKPTTPLKVGATAVQAFVVKGADESPASTTITIINSGQGDDVKPPVPTPEAPKAPTYTVVGIDGRSTVVTFSGPAGDRLVLEDANGGPLTGGKFGANGTSTAFFTTPLSGTATFTARVLGAGGLSAATTVTISAVAEADAPKAPTYTVDSNDGRSAFVTFTGEAGARLRLYDAKGAPVQGDVFADSGKVTKRFDTPPTGSAVYTARVDGKSGLSPATTVTIDAPVYDAPEAPTYTVDSAFLSGVTVTFTGAPFGRLRLFDGNGASVPGGGLDKDGTLTTNLPRPRTGSIDYTARVEGNGGLSPATTVTVKAPEGDELPAAPTYTIDSTRNGVSRVTVKGLPFATLFVKDAQGRSVATVSTGRLGQATVSLSAPRDGTAAYTAQIDKEGWLSPTTNITVEWAN